MFRRSPAGPCGRSAIILGTALGLLLNALSPGCTVPASTPVETVYYLPGVDVARMAGALRQHLRVTAPGTRATVVEIADRDVLWIRARNASALQVADKFIEGWLSAGTSEPRIEALTVAAACRPIVEEMRRRYPRLDLAFDERTHRVFVAGATREQLEAIRGALLECETSTHSRRPPKRGQFRIPVRRCRARRPALDASDD